jgi:hypothetical protein
LQHENNTSALSAGDALSLSTGHLMVLFLSIELGRDFHACLLGTDGMPLLVVSC